MLSYSTGVLIAALPALTSAAMWATMAPQLLGLVTAIGAGRLISVVADRPTFWRFALMVALIIFSAFSYQSLTILALLLPYLGARASMARGERVRWASLAVITSTVGLALILNYLWVMIQNGSGSSRFGAASYDEVGRWMIIEFFPAAIHVLVSTDPLLVAGSVVILIVLLLSPVLLGTRFIWIPTASLVGISSWLAIIFIIRETYVTYRFAMSTQIWLWFSAFFCVAVFVSGIVARRNCLQWYLSVVAIAITMGAVVTSHVTARSSIADPNGRDWLYATCLVERLKNVKAPTEVYLTTTPASQVESLT